MKRALVSVSLLAALSSPLVSSGAENPLFGYTHLLPSPLTLPAGTLVFGTEAAYGLTDFLQVGTNLLANFYNVFNANLKASLVDYPSFALAFTGGYVHFNYNNIDPRNSDMPVTSWQPGIVTAVQVAPALAWFNGVNLNYTSTELVTDGIQKTGYMSGASIGSDLSLAYNSFGGRSRGKGGGGGTNALSAGVSYDISYKMLGVGISHHWPGFHLGMHWYPGADRYPVRPIIAGGGVWQF